MTVTLLSFVLSKYNIRESNSSVEIPNLTHSHTAVRANRSDRAGR